MGLWHDASDPGQEDRVKSLGSLGFRVTYRPLSSSFSELPYRILNMNHEKELLRGLWVGIGLGFRG